MKKILTICVLLFLYQGECLAQVDTEFWFAVPEAVSSHADRPIALYVTNAGQTSANVTVSLPANFSFSPINLSLNPNTTSKVDLTAYIDMLENKAADVVGNKGLKISSNALITSYYEIRGELGGTQYNPELFALKGKNALGKLFFIPMQNIYDNGGYSGPPRAGFDIVATEDNTTVTITPTATLVGNHPANVPFSVTLNKGETYSAQSLSTIGQSKPTGSKVQSSKPIAITYKDDSITPGGCADIIGDQLVPIENIGKEYIIVNGNSGYEYGFITATEDDTDVFANGNSTPIITLNAGQTYAHNLQSAADYISASKPIYVFQLTAIGCEFGGALLPSILCTGSNQVSFTRSNNAQFYLNLITKKGNEDGFILNGNAIASNNFSPVVGTNGLWMAAHIQRQDIPLQTSSTIQNTKGLFHIGLLAGDGGTGMSYGYFSDFSALNIGQDVSICEGDTIILMAGWGKDSYSWSTGSTAPSIAVSQAGTYWIVANTDNCQVSDTVVVATKPVPQIHLGNDTLICKTIDLNLDATLNTTGLKSYLWQDGSLLPTFHVTQTGTYYVAVTEQPEGCTGRDTIVITSGSIPLIIENQQDINCYFPKGSAEVGLVNPDNNVCQFSLDSVNFQTNNVFSQLDSGDYTVFAIDTLGCKGQVNFHIQQYQPPTAAVWTENESCELKNGQASIAVTNGHQPFIYSWLINPTFVTSIPNVAKLDAGSYQVITIDADNCSDTTTFSLINENFPPVEILQQDTTIEIGTTVQLNGLYATDSTYSWSPAMWISCVDCETPSVRPLKSMTYYVQTITGKNCIKIDSIHLTVENHYYFNLPTAFTPNHDGRNDEYQLIHQNIETADIRIFDRWGKVIFQSNNPNDTWNGTFQGKDVPEGVYVISVIYKILGIETTQYAATSITLIR